MRRRIAVLAAAACTICAPVALAQSPPPFLNKQYSDTVHNLRACLSVLSPRDRKLVVLRSGIGTQQPASPQAVASALGISAASVSKAQWAPVHQMRAAQKAGKCSTPAQPAAPKTATNRAPAVKRKVVSAASATTSGGGAGWGQPKVIVLLAIVGMCVLGLGREVLRVVRA